MRVRPELHIGTSGYQYDHWKGVFYPEGLHKEGWLTYYGERFGTVEINATFYRLPEQETVAGWREQVPEGFVFALKLSRYGTHLKHLADPGDWLPRFVEVAEELGPALGPILVQLPPRWHCNLERLAGFFETAPPAHRFAVELRDRSWLCEPVFDLLHEHGAALCVHDLIDDHPRVATADWVYLRFHGPRAGAPYSGSYSPQALSGAARRIRRHLAQGRDVYAYFNNDVAGHAARNAADLRRYLEHG